jgi:predicted MFS family arabinose efflux permease
MIATAPDVQSIIVWRFIQGLTLPSIFAVIIAYIGDEWPASEVAGMAGIYTSGASIGGFSGRFVTGILADLVGWRSAHVVLALMTLVGAAVVAALLPRERHFVKSESLKASLRQMLLHLRNPQLVATYAVGFGTLFNFIALFTYVNFVLAAPPFNLSATLLGAIFVTYLAGSVAVLWLGRAVARFGRRTLIIGTIAVWMCGTLLTLIPSLWAIIAGLAIVAACGFFTQATSTAYVAMIAKSGRTSAIGLYATFFYVGGGFGATLPGLAWNAGGWPACVAMVIAMQAFMAAVIFFAWRR